MTATQAGRLVPVAVEWARYGKLPGDHEGYRVLACSLGAIGARNFKAAISRFDLGTPDELPQVALSYVSLADSPDRRYLALAVAEYQGHKDATGRLIAYTRYFCAPYLELAAGGIGYQEMYQALRGIDLPWADEARRPVELPAAPLPVPSAGSLGMRVAAMLLTGRSVCVIGAAQVSLAERLRFLDGVMSLLPYSMRAKMAAATWTRSTSQHGFRLFFSDNPRPALDGRQADLVAVWDRPDQTPVPPGYRSAHQYLNWLEDGMRSPAETLAAFTAETGFGPDSISGLLAKLGVTASVPRAGSALAALTPEPAGDRLPPPSDHAARIMISIGNRVQAQSTRGLRDDTTMLTNLVNRAVEGGRSPHEALRYQYQSVIVANGLLQPQVLDQLGREARPYCRALLWHAFGLPLSYQGYCQLEDCLRQAGLSCQPPPEVLLRATRDAGFTDSRVAALVLAHLGKGELDKGLAAKQVDIADMVSWLARPWDRPEHGKALGEVLVRWLQVMHKRYKPQYVHALLRPHGYLAPAVQALYPHELRCQVDVLCSVLAAATGGRALDVPDIVMTLRGGNHAPTWGLLCAVLRLLDKNPQERKLVPLAKSAFFAGLLARSEEDIQALLGRYRPPVVEEIFEDLMAAEPTAPVLVRGSGQAPPALPPGGGPEQSGHAGPPPARGSTEPYSQPQPTFAPAPAQPGPEESKGKRFGRLGGIHHR